MFLRRTKMPELTEKDFFVGSKINIFGRQFDIVDYGDEMTKNMLAKYRKKYKVSYFEYMDTFLKQLTFLCYRSFILIKNSILPHLGTILCSLIESNFSINKGLMVQFTADQVRAFLNDQNKGDAQTS